MAEKNDKIIIKYTDDFKLAELPDNIMTVIANRNYIIIAKINKI
ncbi:MAG: hypothetical protein ACYDB5_09620 [bacterium]